MALAHRSAVVDRAHHPVDSAFHQDAKYTIEVEYPRRVIAARKIRAIQLSSDSRDMLWTTGFMLPFIMFSAIDVACTPLWAAIPGCSVITAMMFLVGIVRADLNARATHRNRKHYTKHSRR